ncbi:hypothetical protein [Pseudoxanthomonas putridarboris]|uniref:Uncharacterized protein n=1 Tax=Pseudoxanthomonas putridarboris TaxID=752605 RepID=A0ABU9IZM8_9GAMM
MNSQLLPIRMVSEMTQEEHPLLYDDLIRFPKGTKRINRLRTLTHDGLLFQFGGTDRIKAVSGETTIWEYGLVGDQPDFP